MPLCPLTLLQKGIAPTPRGIVDSQQFFGAGSSFDRNPGASTDSVLFPPDRFHSAGLALLIDWPT